jgi:hypothetical protein
MNKERYYQIIDEVYKNYTSSKDHPLDGKYGDTSVRTLNHMYPYEPILSQDEFINKCKIDTEFSEKWKLKIEEQELSLEEKEWELQKTNCINDIETDRIIYGHEWEKYIQGQYEGIESTQGIIIPTKLITITYNDKTIISYE